MTLNQIIKEIGTKSLNHRGVKHFFYGDISDWPLCKHLRFPSLYCEITSVTVARSGPQYSVRFVLADKVWSTEQNINDTSLTANDIEVQSDTLQTMIDLKAYIDHPSNDWLIPGDPQINIFSTIEMVENVHNVAGAQMEFILLVPGGVNRCDLPLVDDGTSTTAILTEDGFELYTEDGKTIIQG